MATPEEIKQAAVKELAKRELQRRAVPAAEASAAGATGGAGTGKPLRAEMVPSDTVISRIAAGQQPTNIPVNPNWFGGAEDIAPTLKALSAAPAIGFGETAAFMAGAPGSAVAGLSGLMGGPNESYVLPTIEDMRAMLKLPQLRAEQNLPAVPRAGRILARGLEGAASGVPFTGGVFAGAKAAQKAGWGLNEAMQLLATNPQAVMRIGAVIDGGAGSAGEIAAQLVGQDNPDAAEAARAFTTLVTAVGAPKTINAMKEMSMAVKDMVVPKPISRIQQEAGQELAAVRTRQPDAMNVARQNAAEFEQYGMQPPPVGSLTGNAALEAEQNAAIREIPGMAQTERARQAATDAAIRNEMYNAGPSGNVEDLSRAVAARTQSIEDQAAEARMQLAQEVKDAAERQIAGRKGLELLKDTFGADVESTVRNMIAAAEERATAALAPLGEGINARKAGEIFVEELNKARIEFRTLANNAFEEFLKGTDSIKVETDGIRIAAAKASTPSNPLTAKAEESAIPRVIKEIREDNGLARLNPRQLQGLRSVVLDALRDAQGGANANAQNARKLSIVLDAIDDEFDGLEDKIKGLDVLNKWYREGKTALHGGLVRDVGRDLKARGGVGLNPSEIAARYLKSNTTAGAEEAMDEFARTWGGQNGVEPQGALTSGIPSRAPSVIADRAMDEYIIRQMRLETVDQLTGQVNRKALRDWIEKHQVALSRRPELNAKLKTVAGAQDLADAQIKQIQASKAEYERLLRDDPESANIKLLKKQIDDLEVTTDRKLRERQKLRLLINNPQDRLNQIAKMDQGNAREAYRDLLAEAGDDPEAIAGLNAGMWDALTNSVTDPTTGLAGPSPLVDPDAFARLLSTHGDFIEELFGPERKQLLQVMQSLAARNVAGGKPSTMPARPGESSRVADLLNGLVSRSWGVARGVVGVPYVATEAALRAIFPHSRINSINQAEAQRLLERAIYDPDVWDDLVKIAKFPRNKRVARDLANKISGFRNVVGMTLDNRSARTRQDLKALYRNRAAQ